MLVTQADRRILAVVATRVCRGSIVHSCRANSDAAEIESAAHHSSVISGRLAGSQVGTVRRVALRLGGLPYVVDIHRASAPPIRVPRSAPPSCR